MTQPSSELASLDCHVALQTELWYCRCLVGILDVRHTTSCHVISINQFSISCDIRCVYGYNNVRNYRPLSSTLQPCSHVTNSICMRHIWLRFIIWRHCVMCSNYHFACLRSQTRYNTRTGFWVSTYTCFILYILSKQDQRNDVHLSALFT